jgi:hypothetical protein
VFTCVNVSGIKQLSEEQAVRGYRRGNPRLLRRQRVESKGLELEWASRRAGSACSLRCGDRQGSALRSDERAGERRALDRHPRCGCFRAMRKMYFSHVPHDKHDGGAARSGSEARSAGRFRGSAAHPAACWEARHHPLRRRARRAALRPVIERESNTSCMASGVVRARLGHLPSRIERRSAVGFAAVPDADDLDSGFVPVLEEEPVVAAA